MVVTRLEFVTPFMILTPARKSKVRTDPEKQHERLWKIAVFDYHYLLMLDCAIRKAPPSIKNQSPPKSHSINKDLLPYYF